MSDAINITVPKGYSEMSEKQIRYVASLIISKQTPASIQLRCFLRFAGIRPIAKGLDSWLLFAKRNQGKKFFTMDISEINWCAKKMEFLTKQHIGIKPPARIGFLNPFTPCDAQLRDTTFIQYLEAENFYQAFIHTKDEKYLYQLIATLYSRKNEKAYDNNQTDRKAKQLKRIVSDVEKSIVLMWFVGIKESFAIKFPFLFAGAGEKSTTGKPPNMHKIMQSQIRTLTEGNITLEKQVLASSTWSALGELDAKAKEYQEMKKKYPKQFKK